MTDTAAQSGTNGAGLNGSESAAPQANGAATPASNSRPNIVLVVVDDLGWRDLACYGSTFYETPNIDRLAAAGMTFTNAYAASPVCSPTRASLLTGKYPATVGITNFIAEGDGLHPDRGKLVDVPYLKELPQSETTVAKLLRETGYATWHVGKWHLGGGDSLPERHGFDVNIGGSHAGWPGAGGYFSPWTIDGLTDADVPSGTYLTDYLSDQAIGLIEEHKDAGEQPFFLNLWFYTVHTPIEGKSELVAKYIAKATEQGLDDVDPFVEGELFPTEAKRSERVTRRVIQSNPTYAAMVETLDDNMGRIIETLEDQGILDNTLILFTSDNGGLATAEGSPTSNRPLAEGKGWMYEGGTREPFIAHWPGHIDAGSICHQPVTSPDFLPTLLEIVGVQNTGSEHVDGESFAKVLSCPEDLLDREAIFWHFPHYGNQGGSPGSSIRSGEYKLIEFFEDGRVELYNLNNDISEEHDLADSEPDRAADLQGKLARWRESVAAKVPPMNESQLSERSA